MLVADRFGSPVRPTQAMTSSIESIPDSTAQETSSNKMFERYPGTIHQRTANENNDKQLGNRFEVKSAVER